MTTIATQPTVQIRIGDSAITKAANGEILETVEFNEDGTPDWSEAGIADPRGGGGEEGFKALFMAINYAEANAESVGVNIVRLEG